MVAKEIDKEWVKRERGDGATEKRGWEKEKEKDWGEMGNGEGGWMKKRRVGLFYV